MATTTAVPKSSSAEIASEIAEIETELKQATQAAARARMNSADHEAAYFSGLLQQRKKELAAAQAAEALDAQKRQHAQQLILLVETEKEISHMKSEIVATKRVIAELPAKLAASEYQLNQLLRTYAQLKREIAQ